MGKRRKCIADSNRQKSSRKDALSRVILDLKDGDAFTKKNGRNSLEIELSRAFRKSLRREEKSEKPAPRERRSRGKVEIPKAETISPEGVIDGLITRIKILMDPSNVVGL